MSGTGQSESKGRGTGVTEPHTVTHADVRLGDRVKVDADTTVDGVTAIAKWPYTQEDFTPERHPEIPTEERLDTETRTTYVRKQNGMRTTFATRDGQKYAVVDWNQTEDPAYLYLLVIGGEDPDARRWDRVGSVDTVERYGPEPEYLMSQFHWNGGMGSHQDRHVNVLRLAADGEFSGTPTADELPEPDALRELARRRDRDEPQPMSRADIRAINTAFRAAREHVAMTREPVLTSDVETDMERLDIQLNPAKMTARFPDGNGGWTEKPCPWSGPPTGDIPPWKVEQDPSVPGDTRV